jgi:hypothetical protein
VRVWIRWYLGKTFPPVPDLPVKRSIYRLISVLTRVLP